MPNECNTNDILTAPQITSLMWVGSSLVFCSRPLTAATPRPIVSTFMPLTHKSLSTQQQLGIATNLHEFTKGLHKGSAATRNNHCTPTRTLGARFDARGATFTSSRLTIMSASKHLALRNKQTCIEIASGCCSALKWLESTAKRR